MRELVTDCRHAGLPKSRVGAEDDEPTDSTTPERSPRLRLHQPLDGIGGIVGDPLLVLEEPPRLLDGATGPDEKLLDVVRLDRVQPVAGGDGHDQDDGCQETETKGYGDEGRIHGSPVAGRALRRAAIHPPRQVRAVGVQMG